MVTKAKAKKQKQVKKKPARQEHRAKRPVESLEDWTPAVYTTAAWQRSLERDAELRAAKVYPPASSYSMTWQCFRCHGAWTEQGSFALGACTRCHEPRPENDPTAPRHASVAEILTSWQDRY